MERSCISLYEKEKRAADRIPSTRRKRHEFLGQRKSGCCANPRRCRSSSAVTSNLQTKKKGVGGPSEVAQGRCTTLPRGAMARLPILPSVPRPDRRHHPRVHGNGLPANSP